jgi:hypothetical protein
VTVRAFDEIPRYNSPTLPRSETDTRWLCGCGRERPMRFSDAPPVCECGSRMFPAGRGVHVGTPQDRLETARAAHRVAYAAWRRELDRLRAWPDDRPAGWPEAVAAFVNWQAAHVDRVDADIARLAS